MNPNTKVVTNVIAAILNVDKYASRVLIDVNISI
jgi:hypothetical protein